MADPIEARFAVRIPRRDAGVWRWWPALSVVYVGVGITMLLLLADIPTTDMDWFERLLHGSAAVVTILLRRRPIGVIGEQLRQSVSTGRLLSLMNSQARDPARWSRRRTSRETSLEWNEGVFPPARSLVVPYR